jgi:hypothetical protein
MNEQLVSFIHHVRFDVFPHVPEKDKFPLFRFLLRFPIDQPQFVEVIKQLFQSNQFQRFVDFFKQLKRHKGLRVWNPRKDMDLLLTIYFSEEDPEMSRTILITLLNFSITDDITYQQYKMGLNLLFSATCKQDTQMAIAFLRAG